MAASSRSLIPRVWTSCRMSESLGRTCRVGPAKVVIKLDKTAGSMSGPACRETTEDIGPCVEQDTRAVNLCTLPKIGTEGGTIGVDVVAELLPLPWRREVWRQRTSDSVSGRDVPSPL